MGCRGCDSIYAYFMMSILLDFTPQLDFAAGSYAMEEERTEQGWCARRVDGAGVTRRGGRAEGAGVMRRGGEAGCCAHHCRGCGQRRRDSACRGREGGDTTGGGYTSVLSVLCHGGARAYEMHMGCNLAHVG